MLKTINGNLCFESFITFARVLLPDPNNKNSSVFTRVPFSRGLHKHLLVFWGKHWPHFCTSGETEAGARQLSPAQGGRARLTWWGSDSLRTSVCPCGLLTRLNGNEHHSHLKDKTLSSTRLLRSSFPGRQIWAALFSQHN